MKDFKTRASGTSPPPSSALTAEPSSSLGNLVMESLSSDWTDEKHSLYLKSMEASFVDQLYDNRQKHLNTRTPSGQFKVLRGGCWQKINFKRGDSQLKKADGSRSLLANPWIQHFRSACTTQVVASGDVQKNDASTSQALDVAGNNAIFCGTATSNSNQIHARYYQYLCHQDSADSNTEVSDQNFVDEEVEGEKESDMHADVKRIKSCTTNASSNDQVVPHDKSPATEDVKADNCISEAR